MRENSKKRITRTKFTIGTRGPHTFVSDMFISSSVPSCLQGSRLLTEHYTFFQTHTHTQSLLELEVHSTKLKPIWKLKIETIFKWSYFKVESSYKFFYSLLICSDLPNHVTTSGLERIVWERTLLRFTCLEESKQFSDPNLWWGLQTVGQRKKAPRSSKSPRFLFLVLLVA